MQNKKKKTTQKIKLLKLDFYFYIKNEEINKIEFEHRYVSVYTTYKIYGRHIQDI